MHMREWVKHHYFCRWNNLLMCKSNLCPDLGRTRPIVHTSSGGHRWVHSAFWSLFCNLYISKASKTIVKWPWLPMYYKHWLPTGWPWRRRTKDYSVWLEEVCQSGRSPGEHYADHAAFLSCRHAEHKMHGLIVSTTCLNYNSGGSLCSLKRYWRVTIAA